MAGARLAKGIKFSMKVISSKFKKRIPKSGQTGYVFDLVLQDSLNTRYYVEYVSTIEENRAFKPDEDVCFEVAYANVYTDEIEPASPDATVQVVGVPPPTGLDANNSIATQIPGKKIPNCDNSVAAMNMAKDIFISQINAGNITDVNVMSLSEMFTWAGLINNTLCEMQQP